MSGYWARPCHACGQKIRWQGTVADMPPCPRCAPANAVATATAPAAPQVARRRGVRIEPPEPDETAEAALEICDEIDSMIPGLPDRAWDFGVSVSEKTANIRASIETRGRATDGQITALENMRDGVARWFD